MIPDNRIEELWAQNLPILFTDPESTSALCDTRYEALAYAHTGECLHQDTSIMMEQKTHIYFPHLYGENNELYPILFQSAVKGVEDDDETAIKQPSLVKSIGHVWEIKKECAIQQEASVTNGATSHDDESKKKSEDKDMAIMKSNAQELSNEVQLSSVPSESAEGAAKNNTSNSNGIQINDNTVLSLTSANLAPSTDVCTAPSTEKDADTSERDECTAHQLIGLQSGDVCIAPSTERDADTKKREKERAEFVAKVRKSMGMSATKPKKPPMSDSEFLKLFGKDLNEHGKQPAPDIIQLEAFNLMHARHQLIIQDVSMIIKMLCIVSTS